MARYMRKGTTRIYWVPTVASATAGPTAAEMAAGQDLTDQLAEINGFMFQNNPINTPDMGSAFVTKIPGEDTTDDSSLTFYEDKVTNPIATALTKGSNGYVIIFYAGIADQTAPYVVAAADKCDVWPSQVASNSKQFTADNEAAKYMVSFSNTAAPRVNVAVT